MKLISGCVGKKCISIIVFILSAFIFLPSLTAQEQEVGTETLSLIGSNEIPENVRLTIVIVTACLILCAFIGILFLGWFKDRNLDKGEMRRAIAGTFVIGFTVLMILCLSFNIYQKEVIIAYIELVGIVIGFYFGAKTAAEKKAEAAAKIDIENIRFIDPGKIAITIRNGGGTDITVDKIYLNNGVINKKNEKINSLSSKEIEEEYQWNKGEKYTLKIATTTGLNAEVSITAP